MPPLADEDKKKIVEDYNVGLSPLQLAHKYYREVSEILDVIGQGSMNSIHFIGDQLDEPIPGVEQVPYHTFKQKYDKN